MEVAAAAAAGAGVVELQLDLLEAAAPTEREAKRRRVHPVPAGPPAGGTAAAAPGRRSRRRRAVQRLFQACRHVFRGPGTVPSPGEVQLLRHMLDRMRPEDVGLSPDLSFFRARDATRGGGTPTITHTTIYKCPNFSMVILFLPRNAVIPLHNHPGMTVFSKLLLGSMHVKSYDWLNTADPDPSSATSTTSTSSSSSDGPCLRLAELVVDDVFTAPCDTSVLYPTAGGNMHRFTAMAPCAILDVLGPPYSIEEDRDCTYYAELPYANHSLVAAGDDVERGQGQGHLAWLEEIDMPRELKMCSVHYGGPPISDE